MSARRLIAVAVAAPAALGALFGAALAVGIADQYRQRARHDEDGPSLAEWFASEPWRQDLS